MMHGKVLPYWTPISIALILALLAGAVFLPGWANAIATGVVLLSLSIAAYAVVQKHMRSQQGRIATARNILIECIGVLLAMLLAGLLGRYVAETFTGPIGDGTIRLVAGIIVGLLTGLAVGILVRRAWGRLVAGSSAGL